MPKIVVELQSANNWFGRDVDILVDGRERGKLSLSDRADIAVEGGSNVLQARVGCVISAELYFRVLERETVGFDCIISGAWHERVLLARAYRRQSDERFKTRDRAFATLESQAHGADV